MKYKIGDICLINKRSYSTKDDYEFVNYLDTGNITKNSISQIQYIDLSSTKLPSRAKRIVQKNDIIYSTVRPNQEHYGFIKETPNNFLVSTGFTVLTPDQEKVDPYWLYCYLTQKTVTNQMQLIAEQNVSTYPSIRPENLAEIELDLPDLETQKKIVRILSALDQKIGLNTKENGTLENIIKCHYKSFISNKDQKRTEYKTSDLFDYNGGYSYTSAELVDESTIGMMTIKNFERTGGFKIDGFKPLAPQKTKIPTADLFDIFVACTDVTQNADIIGNAIMLLDKGEYEDTTYSMDLVKIEPRINKFALYAILSSKDFKNFALGYKSGTTVLHLSKKCLKEYVISLPEEKEVEAFGEIVERLCKKISNNLAENRNLCQIRNVLLPKLLSGEIDVNRIEV